VKFNLSVLLSELHVIMQVYFRHPHPNFIPCNALMHEGSCLECAVKDFYGTFYLFLKVYLTVYSMPLLLFRTKRLFTAPKESLRTLIENTCVSSLHDLQQMIKKKTKKKEKHVLDYLNHELHTRIHRNIQFLPCARLAQAH